jgi:ankyrin repeat protein
MDREPLIRQLLSHASAKDGASAINCSEERVTPLGTAALLGLEKVVRLLLDHGGDPRLAGRWGCTPLHCAVLSPAAARYDIARTLIMAGADREAWAHCIFGCTPLMVAVYANDAEMVRVLVENGCGVNGASKDMTLPVWVARTLGYDEVCDVLVMLGALNSNAGCTALKAALARRGRTLFRSIRFSFLDKEKDWDKRDSIERMMLLFSAVPR